MSLWALLGRWRWRLWSPAPLGLRGERAAARMLKRRGYTIVARSDRGALGEVDIVAIDGRTVVFVEVKTRASLDAGDPSEAVHLDKQRRLTRLALGYLKRHQLQDHPARFDIVAVLWPPGARRPTMEHMVDAFPAVGRESMFS